MLLLFDILLPTIVILSCLLYAQFIFFFFIQQIHFYRTKTKKMKKKFFIDFYGFPPLFVQSISSIRFLYSLLSFRLLMKIKTVGWSYCCCCYLSIIHIKYENFIYHANELKAHCHKTRS